MHIPPDLWDNIATGLGAGASAAAVLAALWATVKLGRQVWAKTIGRRRAQSKLLDKLTCGSSREYIESLFGVRQFSTTEELPTTEGQLVHDIYSLAGAWVMIDFYNDEVIAFSITIRDSNMWYSTKRLMFGRVNVKLGKDNLGNPALSDQEREDRSLHLWYGARTRGAAEALYFGNPGQYQYYWLVHNMAGAGAMEIALGASDYRSGEYLSEEHLNEYDPRPYPAYRRPELSGVTINTLTVLGPYPKAGINHATYMKKTMLGPDHDLLRLAGYWAPGRLSEVKLKMLQLKNKMQAHR